MRCINWFRSYLNRTQCVKIKDTKSSNIGLAAGIAQGTVLGPLLFVFYINDSVKSIEHCKITLFADDCVLYQTGLGQMYLIYCSLTWIR